MIATLAVADGIGANGRKPSAEADLTKKQRFFGRSEGR
jgi:hypothetical protein